MTNDADWIKQRLPSDAASGLVKNGVQSGIDAQVLSSLAANDGRRMLALADLLEVLASDDLYLSESAAGISRGRPMLEERASAWRAREAAKQASAAGLQSIPVERSACSRDEFAT